MDIAREEAGGSCKRATRFQACDMRKEAACFLCNSDVFETPHAKRSTSFKITVSAGTKAGCILKNGVI